MIRLEHIHNKLISNMAENKILEILEDGLFSIEAVSN